MSNNLFSIIEKNIRLNKFCYYENLVGLIFQLLFLLNNQKMI